MRTVGLGCLLTGLLLLHSGCTTSTAIQGNVEYYGNPHITEQLELDTVWAANRANFDLHTKGDLQFVAYYDKDRMMTVASRELGSDKWTKTTLSSKLHWDSHNYVVMGIDEKGFIHVSGNMHVNPLVYYRSAKPLDISNMLELHAMTGEQEDRVTYPKFYNDNDGKLLFNYRAGSCGDGNILVKQFDTETMRWFDYMDRPLFLGVEDDNDRAAYHTYARDAAGDFHFLWMWRWTPDVETCHQLCYAKTSDLRSWTNAFGEPVQLPHRPDVDALIVDDSPSKGGLHNSRKEMILDSKSQPIVGYVKYDQKGYTQLYLARPVNDSWLIKKVSDWDIRWEFIGGGDQMAREAQFDFEGFSDEGYLVITWKTTKDAGTYVVDTDTLEPVALPVKMKQKAPDSLEDKLTDNAELIVHIRPDRGQSLDPQTHYVLKWETQIGSHGKHAPEVIPTEPTSKLYVVKIEEDK